MRRITHLLFSLILIALPIGTKLVAEPEIDVSSLTRPAGALLSPNEVKEEAVIRVEIRKAQRMIREGKVEATTEDRISKMTQRTVDNSPLREVGERKIIEGGLTIEKGAEKY